MGYRPPCPPVVIAEESIERTLQHIESLEQVNAIRMAGMDWEAEWERHRRDYMTTRVSPPPPPKRPRPPQGSRVNNVTEVERR